MVKNKFSKYANASFSLFYAYVFYFDYKLSETHKLTPPVPNVYVSKFVWLTIINLLLQWLYHTTAAILALGKRQPRALMAKFHFISTAIALPASFTVVVLFWTLYLLDPGTLATKEARIIFDIKWFNHAMHTFPLFAMLVDFSIWHHHRPSKCAALMATALFSLFYIALIHYFFVRFNFWAYPILGNLSFGGRALFLLFCTVFMFFAFVIGDAFNKLLHSLNRGRRVGC